MKNDELKKLQQAASPGLWHIEREIIDGHSYPTAIKAADGRWVARADAHYGRPHVNETSQNAAYIVAACNEVPKLLNRIAALREAMTPWRSLIRAHDEALDCDDKAEADQ